MDLEWKSFPLFIVTIVPPVLNYGSLFSFSVIGALSLYNKILGIIRNDFGELCNSLLNFFLLKSFDFDHSLLKWELEFQRWKMVG